jgi:hypothetical protein
MMTFWAISIAVSLFPSQESLTFLRLWLCNSEVEVEIFVGLAQTRLTNFRNAVDRRGRVPTRRSFFVEVRSFTDT